MSDLMHVSDEEFDDFLDQHLEHHGVKGMKWGVRKKYSSNDIKDARARTASRARQLNDQIDRTNLAKSGKQQAHEAKKLNDMSVAFLKDPDRATAQRLTRGEKFALAALAVAVPGPGTAAVVGVGVGRLVGRKITEKQNRDANNGKYDPKPTSKSRL